MTNVPEITPKELKARLDRGDDIYMLDVREPHEYQICNINGHLIPLGELAAARARARQLAGDRGALQAAESAPREAVEFLRKAGFKKDIGI